jgi:hypothetical protein
MNLEVMTLAFSILSHRPPGKVFLRLLDFLRRFDQALIVVHHDFSQSMFPEDIIEKYNLLMINDYEITAWGHVSKLPAILKTFKRIYDINPKVDWVITLSPNCFPIKSVGYIYDFLAKADTDCFMNHDIIKYDSWEVPKSHYITLYTRPSFKLPFFNKSGKFYWRYIRKKLNPEETPFNKNYQPYCGSDWMMFNCKVLKQIIDANLMDHPSIAFITEANKFPDMNASPIEIILQSFIMNQKNLKVEYNYHRYINWEGTTQWHPNNLDMNYYEPIAQSDGLWARKFSDDVSLPLLDKIESMILNK